MSPVTTIALLWLGFAITHMGMSSLRLRPKLVGALGAAGFQVAYSVVALALFVPLCSVYLGNVHAGPLFWSVPFSSALFWAIQVVMAVAFVLLFAGVLSPSPTSIAAQSGRGGAQEPSGVHFITRHAVFMAIGLFGAVHLVPNGHAADVAFFGGFPLFAVVGSIHQDRRRLATDEARYRPFYEATPLLPFTGRNTLRGLRGLSPVAVVLGLVTTVVVRAFHGTWFGGAWFAGGGLGG